MGKTADNQRSIWLSVTGSGAFEVQARNQTVDQWNKSSWGLHVTSSPFVSNGSGDPHSLYQIINDQLVFLDKDNQQGGIVIPPLPGDILPPGIVTPPIYIPPGFVQPPIYYPPLNVMPPIYYPPVNVMPPIYYPPINVMPPIYYPPINIMPPIYYPPDYVPTAPIYPPYYQEPIEITINSNLNYEGFSSLSPLTQGRQFATDPKWNVWDDNRFYTLNDNRFGLDLDGNATNFTVGADRQINEDLVAGIMFGKMNGYSSSFNNNWKTHANGFMVGPYFGYRFSPTWVLDGSVGYNQTNNDNDIASLDGSYLSHAYSLTLQGIGQYPVGTFQLRPKPSVYYTYFHNAAYYLSGMVDDTNTSVLVSADNFKYGITEFALETSRPFLFKGKIITVPYVELGLDYAFARPSSGKVVTDDLTMESTSPWSGLARVGIRTMITNHFFLEATASYLSIGQPKLNIWEGRLYFSFAI